MSKFHFDENVVTNVHTELKETFVRMVEYSAKFTVASNMLYNYVGFRISQAIECSEQERKEIELCIEKIDMGVKSLQYIQEQVSLAEKSAEAENYINTFKYVDTIDLHQSVNKYGHGADYVISGISDAIVDGLTFSYDFKSDETVGLESAINGILKKCGVADEDTLKSVYEDIIKDSGGPSEVLKIFPDLKSNEAINAFFESLGEMSDIVALSDEVITVITANYFSVHKYLDTMAEAYSDNPEMLKIIERYRLTYIDKFQSCMDELRNYCAKNMIKNFTSNGLKLLDKVDKGIVTNFNAIGISLDWTQKALGYDSLYSNSKSLEGLETVRAETSAAYENILAKIKSGVYTENDVKTASNLFDIYKSTLESEYQTMINIEKDKMDSKTGILGRILYPDQLITSRRESTIEAYQQQISEYESKLNEINKMENPFK